MKYILAAFCSLMAIANAWAAQKGPVDANTRQLLVVKVANWNTSTGSLERFERTNTKHHWQQVGKPIKVVVGQHGTAWSALLPSSQITNGPVKKEGDARTPAGIFPIDGAFGFGPAYIKKIRMPYTELSSSSVCVTDPKSKYYNQIVSTNKIKPAKKDWQNQEYLHEIPQNRWGLKVGYNTTHPVPGAGSCVVINVWKSPAQATQGGVALSENDMEDLITWINPTKKPMLIVLPQQQYDSLKQSWKLPN